MSTVWDELAPSNRKCHHGEPDNPDLVLSIAAFVSMPADIRLAATTCPDCAWLVLRARDDDASQSRIQRAWYVLTNKPVRRADLTADQREELDAMVAAGQWYMPS